MSKKKTDGPDDMSGGFTPNKPPPLTKRQRWEKYHDLRLKKAISALRGVLRMANRASYEYTPEEASETVNILSAALMRIEVAFQGGSTIKSPYEL